MIQFRIKLAIILVHSEFNNDDDIRNWSLKYDETNMNPNDYMILDRPPKKLNTSNSSLKLELFSQLLIISQSVNPTKYDLMESSKDEDLLQP